MMIFGGQKRQVGFTLVELLIVIVVIAILAAITLVAYNGIQTRAQNQARTSAVRQTLSLIEGYKAINGDYPPVAKEANNSYAASCVGESWKNTHVGRKICWNIYDDGSVGPSTFYVQDILNNALKEVGGLPDFPDESVDSSYSWGHVSGFIYLDNTDGTAIEYRPKGHSLMWVLKGSPDSTDCVLSGAIKTGFTSSDRATRCTLPLSDATWE